MAGISEPNDLKFINTFEKDLEKKATSGETTGTHSMSMSSFAKDIDIIGKGRYQTQAFELIERTLNGHNRIIYQYDDCHRHHQRQQDNTKRDWDSG